MSENTTRMTLLLSSLRKEMNGAVLDSVAYYGSPYGVNMGVSVHALSALAAEIGTDDDFARYLYRQQIRELQLIAVRVADPERFAIDDADFWAGGVRNSEVAEHISFSFLSRVDSLDILAERWCGSGNELLAYAALLAVAKSRGISSDEIESLTRLGVNAFPDSRLVGRALSSLLTALHSWDAAAYGKIVDSLPDSPTASFLRTETEWMTRYSS